MSRLEKESWKPIPIAPLSQLSQLREMVVAHSEKRMPKWKFRIATDLVIQIQPKVSERFQELFESHAFEFPGVNEKVFLSRREIGRADYASVSFRLYRSEQVWLFKATSAGAWRTVSPNRYHDKPHQKFCTEDALLCRDRLTKVFNGDFFEHIKPSSMLSSHCMICGKGLTDPASMARMIGPECWGNGPLAVPWLYDIREMEGARLIVPVQ